MFTNEFYIGCHYSVIVLYSYCQSYLLFALCDPDKSLSLLSFPTELEKTLFSELVLQKATCRIVIGNGRESKERCVSVLCTLMHRRY